MVLCTVTAMYRPLGDHHSRRQTAIREENIHSANTHRNEGNNTFILQKHVSFVWHTQGGFYRQRAIRKSLPKPCGFKRETNPDKSDLTYARLSSRCTLLSPRSSPAFGPAFPSTCLRTPGPYLPFLPASGKRADYPHGKEPSTQILRLCRTRDCDKHTNPDHLLSLNVPGKNKIRPVKGFWPPNTTLSCGRKINY